ncbi:MAG TPA: formate dehydrogenase subunit delta [Acetobacteraceae bacterium]|jgi:formate dehydrogenase subunit delta|nr:formate dehydrogenase subunit delta [Acetobacteraceae bacterium]
MSPEKLAYMANQIGRFFASQPHDKAVAAIADHLEKFWDPRMRGTIVAQYDEIKDRLDPLVQEAMGRLRKVESA